MNNNQPKQDNIDLRIQEADAIKSLLTTRGFQVLQDKYEEIKHKSFKDLTNESLDDSTLKARQTIYNQICEWVNVPELIIKMGMDAVGESKIEETRGETFIKRAIPYLFRK